MGQHSLYLYTIHMKISGSYESSPNMPHHVTCPVTNGRTESDAYEPTVHKHRCAQSLKKLTVKDWLIPALVWLTWNLLMDGFKMDSDNFMVFEQVLYNFTTCGRSCDESDLIVHHSLLCGQHFVLFNFLLFHLKLSGLFTFSWKEWRKGITINIFG